jgi:hypothetical protein
MFIFPQCFRYSTFSIKSDKTYNPHVLNTTVDGTPGYATSDLIMRHPTETDRYCVYGRVDDQLMLSTGEKVMSTAHYE